MKGKISQHKGMAMGKKCANKGAVALAKGGKVKGAAKEVKVKHVLASKKGGKVK